jgi:branched-chain amino acid aminotransferase
MAAGTAAALVPIRSITRNSRNETSSYIPEDSEEPGPVCTKILTTLKGIQAGKIKDTFGWNSKVDFVDVKKYSTAAGESTNGVNGTSVDELP